MGVSTDGQICFGIAFEEGFEFPWGDDDEGNWWTDQVNGYKPPFSLYDDKGNFLGGKRPPQDQMDRYYDHLREFEAAHPMPVKVVNYCSYDCPMYILAVPSSFMKNSRGFPKDFDPSKLVVSDQEREELLAFCRDHGIEFEGEPKWYLSSLWG
jgi:hypothetical protein